MTPAVEMPQVFCPNCVEQGYLEAYPFAGIPVLSCRLCRWFAMGHWEGTDAVFPDPHVQAHPEIGQSA